MSLPTLDQVQARIEVDPTTGCWLFAGPLDRHGYGRWVRDGHRLAHRTVYAALAGDPGEDLGHACHDSDPSCPGGDGCAHRRCVNPEHLKPMSRADNSLAASLAQRAGVCRNGHKLDEVGWRQPPAMLRRGARECRECRNARRRVS